MSALLIGLTAMTASVEAPAQDAADQVIRATRSTTFSVPIYKSRIVDLPEAVKRVSIGNPDIADVLLLGDDGLYVLGKDLGATNVMLWDREDRLVSALNITVTHDLDNLKKQISLVLPGENVELWSAQRNIVMSGQVSSTAKMDAALQVARGYLEQMATAKEKIMFKQQSSSGGQADKKSGEVINLMTVGGAHQVMLQVKIAEVNREAVRNLNAQFNALQNTGKWVTGGVNGGATFPDALFQPGNVRVPVFGDGTNAGGNPIGPVFDEFAPDLPTINSTGFFGSFLSSDFIANVVLDAYQNRGLAKILAEPTLTTLSGQDAQFLSGGSFPIPVSQDNGTIGIEFKDFGVKLSFIPLILDRGRINLKLNVSVSELANSNSVALTPIGTSAVFTIPSLTERRAASTVELSDGQTIGIAGLMNENMRSAINKFPGLGDIPILGYLFRSQSYQKGETELVIMVTPRLAKPIKPSQIKLPTDAVGDPSSAAFFLGGKIEGEPKPAPAPAAPPSK
ncbi:type II and III secretion system protein family protein [Peristeroidobacter agariperforans]|uniref:type II and III secretion system protein family protein n=1 Tax=Peristeroidobacter agariperforans TaxID=268404 RepID=UPI0018E529BA|nr:type II and III secretion system protein family protein [Peristeroidobacter agariperforans]